MDGGRAHDAICESQRVEFAGGSGGWAASRPPSAADTAGRTTFSPRSARTAWYGNDGRPRSLAFITPVGRSIQTAWGAGIRSLATWAERRHELELAKIQAQALADSQRPQAYEVTSAALPIAQTTVVNVVQRNGGCGSGCGGAMVLLILIGVVSSYSHTTPTPKITTKAVPIREPPAEPPTEPPTEPITETTSEPRPGVITAGCAR